MIIRNLVIVIAVFTYCGILAWAGLRVIGWFERRRSEDAQIKAAWRGTVHRGVATRRSGPRRNRCVHTRTRATLETSNPTFVVFLIGVIVIVSELIYLPMLILGPIGERIVG